jgi:hypothetical protein
MRAKTFSGDREARAGRLLVWPLVVLGQLGCGSYSLDLGRDDQPESDRAHRRPQLWTMFDIHQAYLEGRSVAPTESFPGGFAPQVFVEPGADGAATLKIIPAFSEGEPAAYVIPELWVNFDEIWVQPWYVLVSAWNDRTTAQNRLRDAEGNGYPPVFDVHPRSLFYSPFWLVFYAVVPEDSPIDKYTSAEKLFDEKRAIYPGPPWIYSVRPEAVTLPPMPVHPFLKKPVASFLNQAPVSWVDDQSMPYFNEGSNNFKYDAKLVVEEVPMFMLARRDASGQPALINAPNIIGTGPLLARRPPDAPGGRPRFGSLTRFYFAFVGPTAGMFEPEAYPDAAAALMAKNLDPEAYRGRVASNALKIADTDRPCFTMPDFPAGCRWLDSQAAIEDALGVINLRRTEVAACSPLVFYGGKGVGR